MSSSAHRHAVWHGAVIPQTQCNELLVRTDEAGTSRKVKSKNHSVTGLPEAGIGSQGMDVGTFSLVPISYSPRVGFLSPLLLPL